MTSEPVNIPFAIPIPEPTLQGANGILVLNSKIKTCYKDLGNSKGWKWYTGIITDIKNNNICTIEYDIGFIVTGNANVCHLV